MSSIFWESNILVLENDVYPDRREQKRFEPQAKPIRLSDLQREAGMTCNRTYRQIDMDVTARYSR